MSFSLFKKKYGQNFLVDQNIVQKIVRDIPFLERSCVIEIGCGDGRLTEELCKKCDFVLGYEIDLDVKPFLLERLSCSNNYSIHFNDFLKCDVISDLKDINYDHLYVVANLPYYITTSIIEKLIQTGLLFESMNFMVQKEVGDRFSAVCGSKEYSSLSVYLQYFFDIKKRFIVPRSCFYPVPNVDSVVVSFTKKEQLYLKNRQLFFNLVKDSFQFKRKTLRNNLKKYNLDLIEEVLKEYGYDLSVRAEALSVEIFCTIANKLATNM